MVMVTTTLFRIIQSELIKDGNSEFESETPQTDVFPFGEFVYYEDDFQFTTKILRYDHDISLIVDDLFSGMSLIKNEYDTHFKKSFITRFVNRQINRQTIEAFKMELLTTFLSNEDFINRVYNDMDKFITQTKTNDTKNKQTNKQTNDGTNVTDNRTAFADLPQNNVNLDVNNHDMEYATDNTVTKNKQTSQQETEGTTIGDMSGENKAYSLDELFKTNGLMEQIFNKFDKKCFLQVW